MALTWTDVPENSSVRLALIQELLETNDELASYMDTKANDTGIYSSLPLHNNRIKKFDKIALSEKIYQTIEILNDKQVCVPYCGGNYISKHSSCYSHNESRYSQDYDSEYNNVY